MADDPRRTEEPHDRLTRICDAMTKTLDMHPESRPTDKCMVFLQNGRQGGLVLHGYDDDSEAITDLLMHLKAMMRANGKQLDFMFLGEDGVDRA